MDLSLPAAVRESERLAKLHELLVLDTAPEPTFDAIARMASQFCGAPVALLSLVAEERQWFKANVGLPDATQTPRCEAVCDFTIRSDELLEVPDLAADPRFAAFPAIAGEPHLRFYAGAPVVVDEGARVGSLCVVDYMPRRLTPVQAEQLRGLAKIAAHALQMRRDLLRDTLAARSLYESALADSEARYRGLIEAQSELVSLAREDGTLLYVNHAYARHFGSTPEAMVGSNLFDRVQPHDRARVRRNIEALFEGGEPVSVENRSMVGDAAGSRECWVSWTNQVQNDGGRRVLHSVGRDITERKRAEEALHVSKAMLDRTGRIAGVGGWQLDLRSNELTWSDETRRIHDVAADYQPSLATAIDFYAPEARPVIEAAVQTALSTGQGWDLELPLVTASGRAIWARAQGEVALEDGVPVRLSGAFQDITETRRLRQQLADNERFMRQVTDGVPMRIAYVDLEGRYRFVNLAHCQRFGRQRGQILGRTRAELIGPEQCALPGFQQVDQRLQQALAGQAQHFEYDETTADGVRRRIESRLVPDLDADGRVRGVFTSGVDITERAAAERALAELAAIFENTTDFIVQTDAEGMLTYLNPAVRRALGLAADAPIRHLDFNQFNTPETQALFAELIVPSVRAHGVWVGESTVYLAGRRVLPVSHMVIAHRNAQGRIERFSAVMRDITGPSRARTRLQREKATLQAVIEAMPASVAVVDRDGRLRVVNSAFERLQKRPRADLIDRTLADVLGPAGWAASVGYVKRALAGETVSFEKDYSAVSGIRNLSLSYVPLRMPDGTVDGFVGAGYDVSHHMDDKNALARAAQRDALTGLLNRGGFETALAECRAGGDAQHLAMLYIDLDRFKPVNDQHGHPVGDEVLRQFAARLQALVRPTDAVARLGGDEFAVLLGGVRESSHARAVAAKVVAAAQQCFVVGNLELHIGASVGVAFAGEGGIDALVQRADASLYDAKRSGRGRVG